MKPKLIVEFSELWVKAVLIETQKMQSKVSNIFLEQLAPNVSNFSAAVNNIFIKTGKSRNLDVTVVLNRSKITVRKVDMPSRDTQEIEQMLGLHVIRQVPYPKEEIVWGYENLGFDGISNSRILLAVCHRNMLRNIFNAFVSLNILPDRMLLSSQGVIHYLAACLKDKALMQPACLILDIDYNSSEFMLVTKQQLNSSIVISSGILQLKTDEDKARFIGELKQGLLAFRGDLDQVKMVNLFITGAAAVPGGLAALIEKELSVKTQVIISKDALNYGGVSQEVSASAVLGFAYQYKKDDISFTLPEAQVKKEMKHKIQQFSLIGINVIYLFVLLGLVFFTSLNQRQSLKDKLDVRIKSLKAKTDTLVGVSDTINTVRQYTDTRQTALNYLSELTRLCPESVVISNFSWEKKKGFSIKGYALQMQDIFNFASSLEGSKILKGVQTRSTRRHKIKDKEVVDFEIGQK